MFHIVKLAKILAVLALAVSMPAKSVTVEDSTLLLQREGYGRNTTGGQNGTLYIVNTKADYDETANENPIAGSLRYGVEQMSGRRWIVFDHSLFTSPQNYNRVAAFFDLKRPLEISQGDITIDGRSGAANGQGRVVVLSRQYNWSNYRVIQNDTGNSCEALKDSSGRTLENTGGIIEIAGAQNVIFSHLVFRQFRTGSPALPVAEEECFDDQISIFNEYPKTSAYPDDGDPSLLNSDDSYDRIWINRSQFYV